MMSNKSIPCSQGEIDWHRLIDLPHACSDLEFPSRHLAGKCVLVTGAGGCIGSPLVNAIVNCSPRHVVLLDTSENGLYQIDYRLRSQKSAVEVTTLLGSVCDQSLTAELFDRYRPDTIFHAAAFKHVPLMERNPFAVIANNAFGTHQLAGLALSYGVGCFILISTDKAVDPVSIMGVSKRLAEMSLLALKPTCGIRMKAIRLGNVLGSQGSVVPLFLEQIALGIPVTVTHPDAQRYFMTTQQAVSASLKAMDPAWSESILVPSLGHQTRIADLAQRLIATYGNTLSPPEIIFTGLRPGDKLEELLISNDERWSTNGLESSPSSGLRAVYSPAPELRAFEASMGELRESVLRRDLSGMMAILSRIIPEYRPSSLLEHAATREASMLEGSGV